MEVAILGGLVGLGYLFNPIKGLESLSRKQSTLLFKKSDQVITVEVGLNTPTKRFGLNWMIPYVIRFKSF